MGRSAAQRAPCPSLRFGSGRIGNADGALASHRRNWSCQAAEGDRSNVLSSLVTEEAIGLILQLDCDIQLQRCLNNTAYDKAKEIRAKRTKLDGQIQGLMDRKAAHQGVTTAAQSPWSALDLASEGLRLRTEMQRAVEEERYEDATQFRNLLQDLDRESKRLAAIAEQSKAREPKLRLGQRVTHTTLGFRGLVIGWDLCCCETEEWIEASGAQDLRDSPFYHVLVDVRDWSSSSEMPPVAYVAEALLTAPELEPEGLAWVQVHGSQPLQHPFTELLFLGQDARGDYLPCRHLRNKYNIVRRDVYKPGEDPNQEEEGEHP